MRKMIHGMMAGMLAVVVGTLMAVGPAAAGDADLPAPVREAIGRTAYSSEERQALSSEAARAVKAGIPAEDVAVIVTRSGERGADSAQARQLLATAARTQEQGLPARPVLNRIQQGLAKGVPVEKITAAADRLSDRLQDARPIVNEVVGKGVTAGSARDRDEALETVARALERSLPRDAITEAGARVRERNGSIVLFDKAVGTMNGLAENGMDPVSAARIVQDAVGKGFSEKDLSKLERDVSEGLRKERGKRDDGRRDRKEDRREDRREDRGRGGRDDSRDRDSGSGHGGRGK